MQTTSCIITKNISLDPSCLTSTLRELVYSDLKKKYERVCCGDDGFIVSIDEMIKMDNIINKDSITITFMITFKATTIKPEKDMLVSFVPTLLLQKGIFGKMYDCINFFIPDSTLIDAGYQFNTTTNSFFKKEILKEEVKKGRKKEIIEKELISTIDKDTTVKVKIEQIKYDGIKYNCITSLNTI